jgi:hypothetical protein
MNDPLAERPRRGRTLALALAGYVIVACVTHRPHIRSGWRDELGPVVAHDSFPARCDMCHVGNDWQTLVEDFRFDHEAETGVRLEGAHDRAQCLRCHNDRGSVAEFTARGCAGCHEDIHLGTLGPRCESCHDQETWRPRDQIAMHARTGFTLDGVHAATSCRRCHPGAEVGRFVPTDSECVTCHRDDLAAANNPNHIGLGLVDRCDRCHMPTDWHQVETP